MTHIGFKEPSCFTKGLFIPTNQLCYRISTTTSSPEVVVRFPFLGRAETASSRGNGLAYTLADDHMDPENHWLVEEHYLPFGGQEVRVYVSGLGSVNISATRGSWIVDRPGRFG